jgi:Tol biopolymer transport system component
MKKLAGRGFVYWEILIAVVLYGCSIETFPQVTTGSTLTRADQPQKKIPMVWKNMGLQGRLVYISSSFGSNNGSLVTLIDIEVLDLADGNIKTIFHAPAGDWIDFADISPDGKNLVMEYLPTQDVTSGSKQELIYVMPLDGSQPPRLILAPPTHSDLYYQPTWSPAGKYIYFSHVDLRTSSTTNGQKFPDYELSRMIYPDGQTEKLLDHAFWPRLSPDGSHLLYISVDPFDGSNKLFVADADGSGSRQVVLAGAYIPKIIDAPFFSADNKTIFFSAASPTTSFTPTWTEIIFGITDAFAHVVPSDLWSVPLVGGMPTQLTHIAAFGLFACFSPDNKHIALYTGRGILVMNSDGSDLTNLVNDTGGIPGSVSWLP